MSTPFASERLGWLDGWGSLAGAAAAALALLVAVVVGLAGVPVVRQAVAVAVLTLVPGLLVTRLLGVRLDRADGAIYLVGASIAFLMLLGLGYNTLLRSPFTRPLSVAPFAPLSLTLGVGIGLLGLGAVATLGRGGPPAPRDWLPDGVPSPYALFVVQLPLIAVCASVIDWWYDAPGLRLALIALVGLVPLVYVLVDPGREWAAPSLYLASLALFFQTTLSTKYFTGGDASIEYFFANRVIVDGVWNPTFTGTKTSLLSLVVVHPIYAVVGDIDLLLVMKAVYPMLFAITPVAIYVLHRRTFPDRVAFFGAFLVAFLHPYFNLLTQNTRTGFALLFVALFVATYVDEELPALARSVLSVVFLFGAVVSHYGVAVMFLGMLGVAYAAGLLDYLVAWSATPSRRLRGRTMLLFTTLFLAWYIYTAQGANFEKLTTIVVNDVILGLDDMFAADADSNAQQAVNMGFTSLTYKLIRYEYILLTLASGFGYLLTTARLPIFAWFRRRVPGLERLAPDVDVDPVVHAFVTATMVLLVLSFAPIDLIGVARIYALAAIFIVPYGVYFVYWVLSGLSGPLPSVGDVPVRAAVAVLLIGLLFVNSGFLSATVTHGRSPQPTLEEARIVESGTDRQQYHLYRSYTSPHDVAATGWLFQYERDMDEKIFRAARNGGITPRFFTTADWAYHAEPNPYDAQAYQQTEDGFLVISSYTDLTGYIILEQPDSGAFPYVKLVDASTLDLEEKNVIYANGRTRIYWNG